MIESGQKSLPTKVIGTLQDISQTVRQEYSRISLLNHELRNPLSVIKLNLQTVLNMLVAKSTNPVFRLLQNADSQTEYICALMDDYLHKNWEETGLCYLDLKRFDLDEMIDTEKSMKQAEEELKSAEEWLTKRKLWYAEATITYYKHLQKQYE